MHIKQVFNATVIVAALGYFVDVYDLVLFLIVGKRSLKEIGIESADIIPHFQNLLNIQMLGMLIGGVVWGIMGDKKGRLSVLFGSIITYSLANILNAFVQNMEIYAILRFVAGFGLAGELGAGITLVSEIMKKEDRGYGTMIVASIGVTGAVVAGLVGQIDWRIAYFIGGVLGISLLLLRLGVFESGMFANTKSTRVQRGNFFDLFKDKNRALRYLYCICLGLPVWYIIGILVGLSPVYASALGVFGSIDDSISVILCYSGLVLGDLISGFMSQILQSRKKVFFVFYAFSASVVFLYLNLRGVSMAIFQITLFLLGVSVGFWAIFVTVASEQFGTNLRATVTTTVPNFVRGSLVGIVFVFNWFRNDLNLGIINSSLLVGLMVFMISTVALINLKDTFGKDLDYNELA